MSDSPSSTRNPRHSLRGAFITFEGIDGCGKTTQARLLADKLKAHDYPVVETREPGGTAIGKRLRDVLLDPGITGMTPNCELLLYLADRTQHLAEVIRPALARGDTVICDRFHDATVAYQHHGRGLDLGPVSSLISAEFDPTPPDTTFWLDLDVKAARGRIAARAEVQSAQEGAERGNASPEPPEYPVTRMECEDDNFHLRVSIGYEQLHKSYPQRIVRIDGAGGVEAIHVAIWENLTRRFHVL